MFLLGLLLRITIAILDFCVIDPSSELIKFRTPTAINLMKKFSSYKHRSASEEYSVFEERSTLSRNFDKILILILVNGA